MKPGKFFHRWRRQMATRLAELDQLTAQGKESGGIEEIHDLRVAIRRARLFSRVGTVVTGKATVKQLAQWSHGITEVLGDVRDLDITVAWLARHSQASPLWPASQRARREAWQTATENLTPLPKPVAKAFAKAFQRESAQKRLLKKYLSHTGELQALILDQAGHLNRLSQDEQHQFRRAVRRCRYLLELGLPKREQQESKLLKQLIQFQKTLGEMQDRVVIERLLLKLDAIPSRSKLLTRVRTERKQWLLKSRRTIASLMKLSQQTGANRAES